MFTKHWTFSLRFINSFAIYEFLRQRVAWFIIYMNEKFITAQEMRATGGPDLCKHSQHKIFMVSWRFTVTHHHRNVLCFCKLWEFGWSLDTFMWLSELPQIPGLLPVLPIFMIHESQYFVVTLRSTLTPGKLEFDQIRHQSKIQRTNWSTLSFSGNFAFMV